MSPLQTPYIPNLIMSIKSVKEATIVLILISGCNVKKIKIKRVVHFSLSNLANDAFVGKGKCKAQY